MNIVFFSSALQQPRHQRRITALLKSFTVDVVYSLRDGYLSNLDDMFGAGYFVGTITRKKGFLYYLFSRLAVIARVFRHLLLKKRCSPVYLTSPDQALIAVLCFRKYFIEYGDIQALSKRSKTARLIDYIVCRFALGVIITSPAYYDGYFRSFGLDKDFFCVLENKLPQSLVNLFSNHIEDVDCNNNLYLNDKAIKLGLIGALSRPSIYNIYKELIDSNDNFVINVYGEGDLGPLNTPHPRVFCNGSFKNPNDLPKIYNECDVVLINYEEDDDNVKLALPNKLYESIYFRKPIVCTSGTFLADVVNELGIGFSSPLNADSIKNSIIKCVEHDFSFAWSKIPLERYVSDNTEISDFIKGKLGKKHE